MGNQKATHTPNKSSCFPYKLISGRNDDHEWLRMTNAFILCDLVWNVRKGHAANREGSFNNEGKPETHSNMKNKSADLLQNILECMG